MTSYPVSFDASADVRVPRLQALLRLAALLALALLGGSMGWLGGVLYVGLPVWAAVVAMNRGGEAWRAEHGPRAARLLHWFLAIESWVYLATDRFPLDSPEQSVHFDVRPNSRPTPGSALVRIVTGLPSALVLWLLSLLAGLAWLVALVSVLATQTRPATIQRFLVEVLRWHARLLAYQASLVDEYPPFQLHEPAAAASAV